MPSPAPDHLPPVAHALVTELLLSGPLALDESRISDALAERRMGKSGPGQWTAISDGIARYVGGGEMHVVARPARDWETLTALVEESATWWEGATAAVRHVQVLEVSIQAPNFSAAMTGRLLARLTASVIDVAQRSGVDVLAVVWNEERVLPAEFVQTHAHADPSIALHTALKLGEPDSGYVLRTTGLPKLGVMNIEVTTFDGDIMDVARVLQFWIERLLRDAPILNDGDILEETGPHRITVRHLPASWGGETVYNFAITEGAESVQTRAMVTVLCPECRRTVEAEVMKLHQIEVLMRCPECGAGPIALLEQMVDNIGGGEIEVVFETDDPDALARLLERYDHRFQTRDDAARFLRGVYDGKRATIMVQRKFAGMMSGALATDYPTIRMHSDEALGVMGDGPRGIFNAPSDDTRMQDAMVSARKSVHEFIARMEAPQAGDAAFGVKVRIQDGDAVEHIWMRDVRREGIEFVGRLEARPQQVQNVREGQELRVAVGEISDWGFTNGESLHGNYTVRVMMGSLPKALQASLKSRLVPLE